MGSDPTARRRRAGALLLAGLAILLFGGVNAGVEYWVVNHRAVMDGHWWFQPALLAARLTWVPPAIAAARVLADLRHGPGPGARGAGRAEEARTLEESRRRLRIERVRRILDASERLEMAFQPVIDLRSGHIAHLEALSRFRTEPYRPPNHWFEEATSLGMGADLELLALRRALAEMDRVSSEIGIAVNLSPLVVADPRAVELIVGSDPARTVIEITEHAVVEEYDSLREHLGELRQMGTRLAVDDVGAGYASFSHVVRLTPDVIKLDRVLVSGLDAESPLQGLIGGLADYARHTGAALVAEGIETAGELATLRLLGVTHGQGYFLGAPTPLGEIDQAGDWSHLISIHTAG